MIKSLSVAPVAALALAFALHSHTALASDSKARLLYGSTPAYASKLKANGDQGRVLLRLDVAADGRVRSAHVVQTSSHPELDRAAVAATRDWHFAPARDASGDAIRSRVLFSVLFKPDNTVQPRLAHNLQPSIEVAAQTVTLTLPSNIATAD
jgi:TonB family protein